MSAAALLATVAAMAMPPTGAAPANAVDIPGRYFTPADLQVLVGQTVTWTNDDVTAHSIVADDGAFRAAPLAHGATYQFTFDQPGDYAYYCSIHRGMRGTVHVSALGLTGPSQPVHAGDMAMFDTLVPAGSSFVTLERVTASGAETVASATPGPDGKATFHLDALRPGRYRARAGDLTSAVVPLRVSPRITATAQRHGRRIVVDARIAPAQPGATVALKRYVRNRFDYVPVQTRRTATGTSVRFTLRTSARVALRVGVVKATGGWVPGDSHLVVVPSLRR